MKISIAVLLLVLSSLGLAYAQAPPLGKAQRQAVIEKTVELVGANYVYPERAKVIETVLLKNARAGKYNADVKLDDFLENLNRDMQVAGMDKHLRVNNNPRIVAELKQEAAGASEVSPEFLEMLQESNFRLKRVETLEGNVGYFKFDNFVELRFVKDAFVGAMNFLHNSSSIILDFTDNGGGASETSDLLLSYFLPEGTRTGEAWDRTTNQTTVSTVARAPEVKQMLDTPVYILVSERTASAAEAVAYTLQQSKRAVIIGSQTKGMANAGRLFPIDERLYVMVPTILNKNAVSGTNWEGVGVTPDIAMAPEQAFFSGMVSALRSSAERKTDPKEKYRLNFLAQDYAARIAGEPPPAGFLGACLGEYEGDQRIVLEDGSLHFRKGAANRKLTYMSDYTFIVEGRTDYRIRFALDGGQVTQCEVLWFDDTSDTYKRTK